MGLKKMIKVNFRGIETREFESGTTLLEISKCFRRYFNYPILLASVNNHLMELERPLESKCDIDFFDRSSSVGSSVNSSSIQFLMVVGIKRILGSDCEVVIQNSIDKGVYCTINKDITKEMLNRVSDKMREIASMGLKYTKLSVYRLDAIQFFKKKHQYDKVKVLKYISNSYVNLYRLDDIYDYFFIDMANNTHDLGDFKLTFLDKNSFVLSYSSVYNPDCVYDYVDKPMVNKIFTDYSKWGNSIGIDNAADLNEYVSIGKYNDIIRLSEAYFESQLATIATRVLENNNIKMLLLAGPSSSGKTTTAKKLSVYLQTKGFRTHYISIDDYFLDNKDILLDDNGEYDYESIKALDLNLFNRHLIKLLDGEKVHIPEYNFILGKKEYKSRFIQMDSNDILIIEGLHGLNDELTRSISRKNKFKIFISPFTQINIDNHNRIYTSDTRRLRRIVRDNKTRGKSTSDTLRMWKKIRDGEEKYIYPFQDDVDAIINSALIYEFGVLKTYAEPLLFSVSETDDMYPEALRLINFLRNFLPIPSDDIPRDSVIREFIGGSGFDK